MYAASDWMKAAALGEAWWGFGIGCRGSVGHSELGAAALLKAVWWDLHLASLLTVLFFFLLRPSYVVMGRPLCFVPVIYLLFICYISREA